MHIASYLVRGNLTILRIAVFIPGIYMSLVEKGRQVPNEKGILADPYTLTFLAQAKGKAYYVNQHKSMNWTDGASYCENFDLVLGRIESSQEWKILKKELNSFPGGGVWTDARESRLPTMFSWNQTNTPLNPAIVFGWDDQYVTDQPYIYCAVFFSFNNTDFETGLYPVPCGNHQTVLCQTR